jgi:hypothetical protein
VVGFAIFMIVRGLVVSHSVELGGSCWNDDECKAGSCLVSDHNVCATMCSVASDCPAGFACTAIRVTLQNQGGFHDLGPMKYCIAAAKR